MSDPFAEKELKWAYRMLDSKETDSFDDIKARHRKLSAKHHPDRFRTAKEKEKAEARFKEIQRAFDIVSKVHVRAAA